MRKKGKARYYKLWNELCVGKVGQSPGDLSLCLQKVRPGNINCGTSLCLRKIGQSPCDINCGMICA